MTYDLRQQPGGHEPGDEVESDSAFLCAMCGLPYGEPPVSEVPTGKAPAKPRKSRK